MLFIYSVNKSDTTELPAEDLTCSKIRISKLLPSSLPSQLLRGPLGQDEVDQQSQSGSEQAVTHFANTHGCRAAPKGAETSLEILSTHL